MVWADMLQQIDPEPWRDLRVHKRIVRGDPNNACDPHLSMSQAYCPGQVAGVFEWADYSIKLTEHGWSHGPTYDFWASGDVLWRIENWARSPRAGADTIYVRPDLYTHPDGQPHCGQRCRGA